MMMITSIEKVLSYDRTTYNGAVAPYNGTTANLSEDSECCVGGGV